MSRPVVYMVLNILNASALFFALSSTVLAVGPQQENGPPFEYMITKIRVIDLDKSLEFYSSFFGYEEVLRTPESKEGVVQVYTTKGGRNFQHGLTFVHKKDSVVPYEPGALHTLVFAVKDIENLVDRIEAAGHEITVRPFATENYVTPVTSSAVIAFTVDPNGYRVEMVEWKP